MKTILKIIAVVLILFGILFLWSAFTSELSISNLITGIATTGIGLMLLSIAIRKKQVIQNTYNVDLPGEMKVSTQSCQQCGAPLNANAFKIVNGVPTVECPYCAAVYEVREEPKW